MSRLIKFRAWDNEFDMMFYSNSSDDPLKVTGERIHYLCGCEKPEGHLNYFFFEKAPIMQFTGLNDSKGKEIYEGDIIKYPGNFGNPLIADVQYLYNGFWVVEKDGDHYMPNECEVIGNVYENPELLV